MDQNTGEIFHLIIWIDHTVARFCSVTRERVEEVRVVRAPGTAEHIHHKAGAPGNGHSHPAPAFLREVADAMASAREILIVGPSDAKFALEKYVKMHAPQLGARILGVEPMEKAGYADLYAFAHLFFLQKDHIPNTR